MKMLIKKVIDAIERGKRFMISSHINLEGDSLGSLIATYSLLKKKRKKAWIVVDNVSRKLKERLNEDSVDGISYRVYSYPFEDGVTPRGVRQQPLFGSTQVDFQAQASQDDADVPTF